MLTPGQLAMYWGIYDREGETKANNYLRLVGSEAYTISNPNLRMKKMRSDEEKICQLEDELSLFHSMALEETNRLQLEINRLRLENQILRQGFAA